MYGGQFDICCECECCVYLAIHQGQNYPQKLKLYLTEAPAGDVLKGKNE